MKTRKADGEEQLVSNIALHWMIVCILLPCEQTKINEYDIVRMRWLREKVPLLSRNFLMIFIVINTIDGLYENFLNSDLT